MLGTEPPSAWRANASAPRQIDGVVSDAPAVLAATSLRSSGWPVSGNSYRSQPRAVCQSAAGASLPASNAGSCLQRE